MKFKVFDSNNNDLTDLKDWFVSQEGNLFYFDTMTGDLEKDLDGYKIRWIHQYFNDGRNLSPLLDIIYDK